jgi:hypothetical protein
MSKGSRIFGFIFQQTIAVGLAVFVWGTCVKPEVGFWGIDFVLGLQSFGTGSSFSTWIAMGTPDIYPGHGYQSIPQTLGYNTVAKLIAIVQEVYHRFPDAEKSNEDSSMVHFVDASY